MAFHYLCLLVLMPSVIPSLLVWVGHVASFQYTEWGKGDLDVTSMIISHKIMYICLASRLSPLLTLIRPAAMLWVTLWRGIHGRQLRVASPQQSARNWGHQFCNPQRTAFCQQLCEHESTSVPSQTLRWEHSSKWHLDHSLWETLTQRTQ